MEKCIKEFIAQIEELETEKQRCDKNLLELNKEISRLKIQNQKLEQANKDIDKNFLEKDERTSYSKCTKKSEDVKKLKQKKL